MKNQSFEDNRVIEIGDRKLNELTMEELLHIAVLELCTPSLKYWSKPITIDFDNTMFSDTLFIEYYSTRKSDGAESDKICFFFNFNEFSFHYTRNYDENGNNLSNTKRLSIQSIKYLIAQRFDIPLY